ncbi:MAG TPA: aminotransferase class V-fold PLP-dependent enzyme [Mariprofundaceae bacterium]|nr:aminotransferase class V-fold PLP-dependent enzyme [Mariprofundaceae bacterium]
MLDEFPLDPSLVYLNHAAVAPWPERTAAAVAAFARQNARRGAADYPEWLKTERELRGRLQRLLNAESRDDIALVKNTSEGLSLIAYGLDWRAGDNVVSTDQEFPSNRIVWQSLAKQGVEFRAADISGDDPEAAIIGALDARTRLLSVSSVEYATGLRLDLERLGEACRARGILFCIDAIQSLGAIRFDVLACHADFVVADGHKWMLGPEGLAVFYSKPAAREQLELTQFGWHMVEQAGDFDRPEWTPAKSARCFEPGSPNMLGIVALNASLSLLEEVGMAEVERCVLANAGLLIELLDELPDVCLLTPRDEVRHAGIVSFRFEGLDAAAHAAIYRQLMDEGVICAHRAGGIRFSPHFHTAAEQLQRAVSRAAACRHRPTDQALR